MRLALSTLIAMCAGIAATAGQEPSDAHSYLDELTSLSVGSFTTLEQAMRDERYGVAEAEILRIWPDRDDGVWLYQEQALLGETADAIDMSMKDRPYFARVIHNHEVEPGVVIRSIHKLAHPGRARGAWRDPAALRNLDADDLLPAECRVTLQRIAEDFWRSASEKCPNAYKGAEYALSLGVVTNSVYANWDRGFDSRGNRVWGPAAGGYIFIRKSTEQSGALESNQGESR